MRILHIADTKRQDKSHQTNESSFLKCQATTDSPKVSDIRFIWFDQEPRSVVVLRQRRSAVHFHFIHSLPTHLSPYSGPQMLTRASSLSLRLIRPNNTSDCRISATKSQIFGPVIHRFCTM